MGKIVRVQAKIVNLKQKVVIKLCIESNKSRAKAQKCAANLLDLRLISSSKGNQTQLHSSYELLGPSTVSNKIKGASSSMAKQKVVPKLSMEDAKKRAQAMRCAIGFLGVVSASLEGHKMTLVGEGIDSVALTALLTKKMGYAELVMVAAVEEKKEEKKENVQDRLLLRRLNHTQKDGSLSSQEAKQKWKSACQILAEKSLIPEDTDLEENVRVFKAVMESDNSDRMLCKDSGMTSRRNFFSDNAPNSEAESSTNMTELAKLAEEISKQSQEILNLKNTMNQLVALLQQQCQVSQVCLPSTTDEGRRILSLGRCMIEELQIQLFLIHYHNKKMAN